MKKPTIEDVAQKAGVSKSTVSQFLNKRYKYMSDQTRDRIAELSGSFFSLKLYAERETWSAVSIRPMHMTRMPL